MKFNFNERFNEIIPWKILWIQNSLLDLLPPFIVCDLFPVTKYKKEEKRRQLVKLKYKLYQIVK